MIHLRATLISVSCLIFGIAIVVLTWQYTRTRQPETFLEVPTEVCEASFTLADLTAECDDLGILDGTTPLTEQNGAVTVVPGKNYTLAVAGSVSQAPNLDGGQFMMTLGTTTQTQTGESASTNIFTKTIRIDPLTKTPIIINAQVHHPTLSWIGSAACSLKLNPQLPICYQHSCTKEPDNCPSGLECQTVTVNNQSVNRCVNKDCAGSSNCVCASQCFDTCSDSKPCSEGLDCVSVAGGAKYCAKHNDDIQDVCQASPSRTNCCELPTYKCEELTGSISSPSRGETVTYTCKGAGTVAKYAVFRMKYTDSQDEVTYSQTSPITALNQQLTANWSYTVDTVAAGGTYAAQCRICKTQANADASCTPWGQALPAN